MDTGDAKIGESLHARTAEKPQESRNLVGKKPKKNDNAQNGKIPGNHGRKKEKNPPKLFQKDTGIECKTMPKHRFKFQQNAFELDF